ncbi:hypothetical protein [Streptomyces humi]|uniref:hypothetical protein n=1 Tax=Streptomyces humi TaxID=1428620 RepID=UPI0011602BD5|nr:hypothetical protein [Streptomyces humi]
MTSLTLAACGAGAPGKTGAAGTSGADAKPLSEADLVRATVTGTDLDGYEVQRDLASTSASRKTADPSSCAPAVQAVGGSSGFAATARTARIISSKDHGPSAHLTLSSHGSGDAERVIDALRTAAERCRTFKDVLVDFDYDGVEVRSDPGYGDESVSLRLTQLAGGADEEPVRVPYAVVAVRQGATVAMFTTFNRPQGKGAAEPAAVPEAVIRAQLAKLDKVTDSG